MSSIEVPPHLSLQKQVNDEKDQKCLGLYTFSDAEGLYQSRGELVKADEIYEKRHHDKWDMETRGRYHGATHQYIEGLRETMKLGDSQLIIDEYETPEKAASFALWLVRHCNGRSAAFESMISFLITYSEAKASSPNAEEKKPCVIYRNIMSELETHCYEDDKILWAKILLETGGSQALLSEEKKAYDDGRLFEAALLAETRARAVLCFSKTFPVAKDFKIGSFMTPEAESYFDDMVKARDLESAEKILYFIKDTSRADSFKRERDCLEKGDVLSAHNAAGARGDRMSLEEYRREVKNCE